MFGAIEAGGTKFVCAVSKTGHQIIAKKTIATRSPVETMEELYSFFDSFSLRAIGIGSFGPIDVNPRSKTHGYITTTPKKEWAHFNFVGKVKERYKVPVAWTTDVNAAAYGEYAKGAAKEVSNCIYVTVGTGIGGGAIVNDRLLQEPYHPEMGHVLVRKHADDSFKGICPYHGDCVEGLASGPAIAARTGKEPSKIQTDHQVWEFVAKYIAQALLFYTYTLRSEKIIVGGGVMNQMHLYPLIRKNFMAYMNSYIEIPPIDSYIVAPALRGEQALYGCFLLAKNKLQSILARR